MTETTNEVSETSELPTPVMIWLDSFALAPRYYFDDEEPETDAAATAGRWTDDA